MGKGRRAARAGRSAATPKPGTPASPGATPPHRTSPVSADAVQRNKRRISAATVWLAVALVAITVTAYAPVRHHDFVSIDDEIYIGDNPLVRAGVSWPGVARAFTSTYANFWHPLTLLSLMLDVQVFGVNAGALHLTNLLLHVGATLLLFWVLWRMTGSPGRSAFVAALFAVHPLHVESVAWISERKDVLSTFFWMATLWAYVEYVRAPRWTRYGLVLVLLALGLMAKPMLVTLPFTLLLLDVWPLSRVALSAVGDVPSRWPAWSRTWVVLLWEKAPMIALAAAAAAAAFVVQRRGGAVATLEQIPVAGRLANALVAYVGYPAKMIWPHALAVYYPYPQTAPIWPAIGALAALVGASILAVRTATRRPYIAVGWFWYVDTLLPVSGLVQVGGHTMADRYSYVPLVGLFIIVAWGVPDLLGRARATRIALAAVGSAAVAVCAVATRAQVMTWKDSMTLWQHAVDVMPGNYYAQNALGLELDKQGRTGEAAARFERSIRLAPAFANPHNNLGLLLAEQGKLAEAIAQYDEALRLKPDYVQAHVNLGNALTKTGRADEAIAQLTEALRLKPDSPVGHTDLGTALMQAGRLEQAIAEFETAVRLDPNVADAHFNLGNALRRMGRLDAAVGQYREAVRLEARSADIRINLGVALEEMGRHEDAIAEFREVLKLDSNSAAARANLGTALLQMGRPADAVEPLREAVRLKPDYADAHMSLGTALFDMGRIEEALAEHREAARLAPDFANTHYNLAITLQRLGHLAEAAAQYQETLRLEGDSAGVHVALGIVLEELGRAEEALLHYREALTLKPDSADASAGVTRALTKLKRRAP